MVKFPFFLPMVLCLMAAPSAFAQGPVHVALNASSVVTSAAAGFFTLGQIAVLSGGEATMRTRMAAVPVGRLPLPGGTRRLAWGDVALKLRQVGFHPDKDALHVGAEQISVTVAPDAAPAPEGVAAGESPSPSAPPSLGTGGAVLVHRGDAVTILVQSGALTVTARGVARDGGGAGATIRVHREGVMADLSVTIVDAQTVQLEM